MSARATHYIKLAVRAVATHLRGVKLMKKTPAQSVRRADDGC